MRDARFALERDDAIGRPRPFFRRKVSRRAVVAGDGWLLTRLRGGQSALKTRDEPRWALMLYSQRSARPKQAVRFNAYRR